MMSDMEATPDTPAARKAQTIPYPTNQIIFLLILAFAEPITYTQKAPYIPQARDLHIVDSSSLIFNSEFLSVVNRRSRYYWR